MKIITGDEFGLIKLISTQSKQVLDQYGVIDSSKSILNIFSNNKIELKENSDNNNNTNLNQNEGKEEDNLNLFISSINENYILNWNTKKIISSYKNQNPNTSFISSAIKFQSPNNNNNIFINGTSDDKINIISFNSENKYINSSIYWPVDNSNKFLKIRLRGVSNSIYNNNESVYCLYQNTPLVLYNIEQQKVEFKGKNLPHDELGLRIPIHDTDIIEIKNNPRLNYVSTAYGEIRFYDKKASPKPSMNKKVTKSKINKIDITEDNNYLFIGDNQGYCAMLDIRKSFHPCKTFKGNSGSIKSLVNIEKNNNLIVAGFDRYVRWYDYKSGNNDKVFVKNKINSTILVGFEPEKKINFEDDEESEINDSDILDEEDEESNEEEDEEDNEEEDIKEKINKNKKIKNKKEKGKDEGDEEYEEKDEEDEENESGENENEKGKEEEHKKEKDNKDDEDGGVDNEEEENEEDEEENLDIDDEDEEYEDEEDEEDEESEINEEDEDSENDKKRKKKNDNKNKNKNKNDSQNLNKNKKKKLI